MSAKIAAIGDSISIMPFKAFGVDTYAHTPAEMTEAVFSDIVAKGYRIIYITERLAQPIMETISEYDTVPSVSVTLIPDSMGDTGLSQKLLRTMIIRAVGADTISEE